MLTDRSIEAARALQLQGRTAAAEALYRELLQNQPEYVGALEALGVLVFQQGRAQEALHLFARGDDSAGVSPDAGRTWGSSSRSSAGTTRPWTTFAKPSRSIRR